MDLSWVYPKDLVEFSIILMTYLLLDFIYPLHRGFMYRIHPVHTAYFMALRLYRKLPKTKLAGVFIWFSVVGVHLTFYSIMLYLANSVSRILWIFTSIYILKVSVALKLLLIHVDETGKYLMRGDLINARKAISGAVRRDVSSLDSGHIASAAIETLFENLVDGFTSPLLYYLLLGPLGAFLQRLANTLDAAIGYKVGDFIMVGWFSARVDDIINYVPARITTVMIAMLCKLINGHLGSSLATCFRDRRLLDSVNAGIILASVSGCLRVKLEKIGYYSVGSEYRLPSEYDVFRAERLSIYASLLYVALLHAGALVIWGLG